MAKKNQPLIGECVHCGQVGPVTRDHVPPKGLFGKPRPRLETVSSCDDCNAGASKDDEYFRAMLLLHDTAGDHVDAVAIRDTFFRSLQNPAKAGFRRAIYETMREVDVTTPAGVFVERRTTYDIDPARLSRVATRTLTGMFALRTGHRVPDEYVARAIPIAAYDQNDEDLRDMVALAVANPSTVVGDRVLEYWVHFLSGDQCEWSVWLFRYYGAFDFLGLTIPAQHAPSLTSRRRA